MPDSWNRGQLAHLIPTASSDRFLIKASFFAPPDETPYLTVDERRVAGTATGPNGRFWRFDARGLEPSTSYVLQLTDPDGGALCDPWRLETFPDPEDTPQRMRILAYTCAGGFDGPPIHGKTTFLQMAARRRLLGRGLGFRPDVVIANGDHLYWDMQTSLNKPYADYIRENVWTRFGGRLDLSVPMLHPRNATIFTSICDYQIAGLYGVELRSTPAFFLSDDHDMFENDEFDRQLATLPPETYGKLGAEQTQRLYYPEFLPDRNRPVWLPGGDKAGQPEGTNMTFGTLRFGTLLEAVLYDCRRYIDSKGDHAKVLPQWVEDWLLARTRSEDTVHFFHAPSLPFGYSCGKVGDWYPDLLDERTGRMVMSQEKAGWQRGWFAQHQRLIDALSSQRLRQAVVVEGDFHASGIGAMTRSGELRLQRPVHVVMTGTLGSGDLEFPSARRSVESKPSQLVGMDEALPLTEKNGFTIIDVTPDAMTFAVFVWRPPESIENIDTLRPAYVYEVLRKR